MRRIIPLCFLHPKIFQGLELCKPKTNNWCTDIYIYHSLCSKRRYRLRWTKPNEQLQRMGRVRGKTNIFKRIDSEIFGSCACFYSSWIGNTSNCILFQKKIVLSITLPSDSDQWDSNRKERWRRSHRLWCFRQPQKDVFQYAKRKILYSVLDSHPPEIESFPGF